MYELCFKYLTKSIDIHPCSGHLYQADCMQCVLGVTHLIEADGEPLL